MPPGQAKRLWAIGAALPATVAFYPLPPPLLAQLTPAPEGYQYVRVDNDILLLTTSTRYKEHALDVPKTTQSEVLRARDDANAPRAVVGRQGEERQRVVRHVQRTGRSGD